MTQLIILNYSIKKSLRMTNHEHIYAVVCTSASGRVKFSTCKCIKIIKERKNKKDGENTNFFFFGQMLTVEFFDIIFSRQCRFIHDQSRHGGRNEHREPVWDFSIKKHVSHANTPIMSFILSFRNTQRYLWFSNVNGSRI